MPRTFITRLRRDVDILREGFATLWQNDSLADLTIVCQDGKLQAHQFVLAVASPLFREVLSNPWVNQEDSATILLPDFSSEQVRTTVSFLYGMGGEDLEVRHQSWMHSLLASLRIGGGWEIRALGVPPAANIKEEPSGDLQHLHHVAEDDEEENEVESDGDYYPPGGDEASEPDEEEKKQVKRKGRKKRYVQLSDGKWQCVLCNQTYQNRHMFYGHYDEDHSEPDKVKRQKKISGYIEIDGGWECTNCKYFVEHRFKLRNHLCFSSFGDDQQLEDEDYWSCGGCTSAFDGKRALIEHLNGCPDGGGSSTFPCERCDLIFFDRDSAKFHSMQLHEGSFSCEYCDKCFDTGENYIKHWTISHSRAQSEHKCTHCGKIYDYKKNLLNHMKTQCGGGSGKKVGHACGQCDRVFNSKSSLHYHKQKHTTPTLQCSKCPRSFKSAKGLKYHMNIHEGVADYVCDHCGRGFVTKQKLVNHQRSKHTFEKPYVCDECGADFTRSDKLTLHRRRAHTHEKPYKCEHCDWRGVDSSGLIHHRKKHLATGDGKKTATKRQSTATLGTDEEESTAGETKRKRVSTSTPQAFAASSVSDSQAAKQNQQQYLMPLALAESQLTLQHFRQQQHLGHLVMQQQQQPVIVAANSSLPTVLTQYVRSYNAADTNQLFTQQHPESQRR